MSFWQREGIRNKKSRYIQVKDDTEESEDEASTPSNIPEVSPITLAVQEATTSKHLYKISPNPEVSPAPAMSPIPEVSLTPEMSPIPEVSPAPAMSPIPEVSLTPEMSPIPEVSPAPAMSPIPEVSTTPEMSPIPEVSPAPAMSPISEVSPTPEMSPIPEQEIEKPQSTSRQGKENYLCTYCNKDGIARYWQHMKRKHMDIKHIADIENIKDTAKKRRITRSMAAKALLTVGVCKGSKRAVHDLKPCPFCHCGVSRRTLYKHVKNCQSRPGFVNPTRIQSASRTVQITYEMPNLTPELARVLAKMREDEQYRTARMDPLIMSYGLHMVKKCRVSEDGLDGKVRSVLRELARFLIHAKKMNEKIKTLVDIFDPALYPFFELLCEQLVEFNNKEYKKPSVALNLGPLLKDVADVALAMCNQRSDDKGSDRIARFNQMYSVYYYVHLGKSGKKQLSRAKWAKAHFLPLSADVGKLHKYLKDTMSQAINYLLNKFDKELYYKLSKSLLVQIMVFNRRRPGEMSKISLVSYLNRKQVDKDSELYGTLSKGAKILSSRYTTSKISGKGGKPLIVLLSPLEIKCLDYIIQNRSKAEIIDTNEYLFGFVDTKINASEALRRASIGCGAKSPELLRSTKLRKHLATMMQALAFTDSEKKMMAEYMGHDWQTHRHYYEMPEEMSAATKVARVLMAFERNEVDMNVNKKLDDLVMDVSLSEGEEEEVPKPSRAGKLVPTTSFTVSPDHTPPQPSTSPQPSCSTWASPQPSTSTRHSMGDDDNWTPTKANASDSSESESPEKSPNRAELVSRKFWTPTRQRTFAPRRKWSTPEKKIIQSQFKQNILTGSLPSLIDCEKVRSKYLTVLCKRTAKVIKAHINNIIRDKKKKK